MLFGSRYFYTMIITIGLGNDYNNLKLELVDAFNYIYRSAKPPRSKNRVLQYFCNQIRTSHHWLETHARAIEAVIR